MPRQGSVSVLGLDPQRDRRDLLPRIGVMLQDGGAWSGVRAMEMLRHIARLHADPLDVDELGRRLGLGDCGRTPYRRLSGGQQQRLKLAMAIVGRPELVFVDEPTAGMDPAGRRTTWELLTQLRDDGVTVVLTTHHMDEAERLADRIHIIDRGRMIASGTALELTRGGTSTIRLVVTKPFPDGAPDSLRQALGDRLEVTTISDVSLLITGPADSTTLATVSAWCEQEGRAPGVAATSASATSRTPSWSSPDGSCREPRRARPRLHARARRRAPLPAGARAGGDGVAADAAQRRAAPAGRRHPGDRADRRRRRAHATSTSS